MENAARALEMAAGVLLGVLLMAAISYFFSNIGEMPEQEDEIMKQEQLAEFNESFEVFQKSGMYGVDVISCLNKAKSNNEKYAEGRRFLSGSAYGDQFKIDVYVNINEPLKEMVEVYAYSNSIKKLVQIFPNSTETSGDTLQEVGLITSADHYEYTSFTPSMDIFFAASKGEVVLTGDDFLVPTNGEDMTPPTQTYTKKYFSLRKNEASSEDNELEKLLQFSNTMKIQKMNLKSNKDVWNSVIWTTALYDFKTKKFKCDYLGYNEDNGRVNVIYFSEI